MASHRLLRSAQWRLIGKILHFHPSSIAARRARERIEAEAANHIPHRAIRAVIAAGLRDHLDTKTATVCGLVLSVPKGTDVDSLDADPRVRAYVSKTYPARRRQALRDQCGSARRGASHEVQRYSTTSALLRAHPELAAIVAWAFDDGPQPTERQGLTALRKGGWL